MSCERTCTTCAHRDADYAGPECGDSGCFNGPGYPNWTAPVGHNGGPPLNDLMLPDDDALRGDFPMFDGLLRYFPNALAEVSRVSKIGNDQQNPGQPMHWARGKSTDHGNKILRHLVDAGKFDGRGVRHTARAAWRILAMLQEELERDEGLPPSPASTDRPF